MASFIIHTIVGEQFLNKIENKYKIKLTDYEKKEFLLGNLIVDSLKVDKSIPNNLTEEEKKEYKITLKNKIRNEKVTTHFRNPEKEELCLKIPEPDIFIKKYSNIIENDYTALGYLFHLYTDKIFFSDLFPKTFETLDSNKEKTNYEKDAKYIRVFKNNILVDNKEFWASTTDINIYADYTIMNSILLKKYGTSFAKEPLINFAKTNFKNPGINEVDYDKIIEIIISTDNYINESFSNDKKTELKVFKEKQIIDFINQVPEQFITEYNNILKTIFSNKRK